MTATILATNWPHDSRPKPAKSGLFTTVFAVPWTNNASKQAIKNPKLHQKVSGYWHTTSTLSAFCRVRSYLTNTRGHGIHAIHTIHTALACNPWLPTPATD